MLHKEFVAQFKALTAEDGATKPGEFEALIAVYDNVDKVGDRIKSGAFDETLDAWRKSGDPIPIVLAHEWNDPWKHIGYASPEDVRSVPGRGLYAKGVLDVDDNPLAKQVHRLMERRTLKEFSFGYRVPEGGEKKADDGAFDLTNLDLIEFGPCLKGVNPETELLAVKAELAAAQRREAGAEPTLEERLTRLEAAVAKALAPEGKPEGEDDKAKAEAEELAARIAAFDNESPQPTEPPEPPAEDAKSESGDALRREALALLETKFTGCGDDADLKERLAQAGL